MLFYYGYIAKPVQIADVIPRPIYLNGVKAVNVRTLGRVDNGVVPLEINGSIIDPSIDRLTLLTGPPNSVPNQPQVGCCVISQQNFAGTAQVGTTHSVVTFRLVSPGTDTIEASGTLAVSVESFPGGGSKLAIDIIAFVSLLATVISVIQWRLPRLSNLQEADRAKQA